MTDSPCQPIIERLREGVNGEYANYALRLEAADHIEELEAELNRAMREIVDLRMPIRGVARAEK